MLAIWVVVFDIEYSTSVEIYPTKDEANRSVVDWIINDSGDWDEENFKEYLASPMPFNKDNLDFLQLEMLIDWYVNQEPDNTFEIVRMEIDPFEYLNKQGKS